MNEYKIPKNPDEFISMAEQIFGIELYTYQKIFLKMLWKKDNLKKYLLSPYQYKCIEGELND